MKKLTMKKGILLMMICSLIVIGSGCNASKSAKGGLIGAGAGAAAGAAIGHGEGNTALGAIIGAVVGGTAGSLIGKKMDKQAEELEQEIEGAEVTRVGEGIRVTFDSGLMFATNQHALNSATKENLDNVAENLNKYEGTEILIEGHTDSDGTEEYNQSLSLKRATSVSEYLANKGVDPSRLKIMGYGESQPLVDNDSAENKQKNRRVEVAIYASEDMIEAAESGTLEIQD